MATYIQHGNSIDYRNTAEEAVLPHGSVVALASCIGVVAADIPAGETGVLHLTEVWELPATGEIDLGAKVCWDKTKEMIVTAANGANLIPAGVAVTAKTDTGDGSVRVRLSP